MKTLTETKHTPGPWKFHLGNGAKPRFHVQTSIMREAIKRERVLRSDLEHKCSELLAACKAALDCITPTGQDTKSDRAIKTLQSAIEHAEKGSL